MPDVVLTGDDLDPAVLAAVARDDARVEIDPRARERVQASHQVVLRAADAGRAVYGVTTGLGSRVGEPVDGAQAAEYSLRTLRGRAVAVGEPLARDATRAAMVARLNGICAGGSGASLGVAEGLARLLNAGVHPVIPRSGSVGAADLCLLAHLGLGLIGEGWAEFGGAVMPASRALELAGAPAVGLEAKDGLAICSSSAVSVGVAALALHDARLALAAAQISAALAMEGFRANLTPLDPRVVAARPAPGQAWSAEGLRSMLAGGELTEPGAARRLQDPLSFRCASQIHGSLHAALEFLAAAVAPDLNGAGDNPLVLTADDEILSNGNFHVPALALALDATAVAVAQVASPLAERPARLRTPALSGLPVSLAAAGPTHAGVSPLLKTAQSLTLEIRALTAPLAIHATVSAEGVEDDSTGATQAALRLLDGVGRLRLLVALELVVAAQAVDLAAPGRLGRGTEVAWRRVRELVAPLTDDRPLGADVQRVADELVAGGALVAAVQDAI